MDILKKISTAYSQKVSIAVIYFQQKIFELMKSLLKFFALFVDVCS